MNSNQHVNAIFVVFGLVAVAVESLVPSPLQTVLRLSLSLSRPSPSLYHWPLSLQSSTVLCSSADKSDDSQSSLRTESRLPTSVEDQVRQAAAALRRATRDIDHDDPTPSSCTRRHIVRLLLPVIGATELDDWPGGARQMMQAAEPLVRQILKQWHYQAATTSREDELKLQSMVVDANDGVVAILAQARDAKDDSCTVLLPSADTIPRIQLELEPQVGPKRNLIVVNPQWKRLSDFGGGSGGWGGWFRSNDDSVSSSDGATYAETFVPTFSLTNLSCEGESIRVYRAHPSPWLVFVRKILDDGTVDWSLVGTKDFERAKPIGWEQRSENQRDGGKVFDYGQPTYQEIQLMLMSSSNYTPKNPAERAAAAFDFIKDSF